MSSPPVKNIFNTAPVRFSAGNFNENRFVFPTPTMYSKKNDHAYVHAGPCLVNALHEIKYSRS